jgi:hypothetical protein
VALIATGALAVVVVALTGTVMAILGSEIACMGGGGSALAAPATRAAEREIEPGRLRIYQAAGRRIDIDWSFLASIGEQECGEGNCAGVNSSGCAGPMQIGYVRGSACSPGSGPTIWELYRVDGDGDGVTDVNNPADAIFTAARILRKEKGAPPAGGSYAAYREAACGYYGACVDGVANYADEVMARAVSYWLRRQRHSTLQRRGRRAGSQRRLGLRIEFGRHGERQRDRPHRAEPARHSREPARIELQSLRAVRGMVLAVRRLGLAAGGRPAGGQHRDLRLLGHRLRMDAGPRRRRADRRHGPRRAALLHG